MQPKTTRTLNLIAIVILFAALFYSYLSRPLWDYDFWWHISTGRYIVETGHLPDNDPFSYTSALSENKNLYPDYEALVLKNYWLAQVIFYEVYKTFGDTGIIILRSSILILVMLSVFWSLRKASVRYYIIFPLLFFTYYTTMSFIGERPVLFTILFSVIVFLLLDAFRQSRARTIFLLIPIMLLWANLHGGVIIGVAIIGISIIGETFDITLKRVSYTKRELFVFYSATILSLAVSAINPNGLDTFIVPLSPEFRAFTKDIQEYQSVFILYWNRIRSIDIGYIALVILFPIILALRARKMALSHILLLSGLLIVSITALRFLVFYVVIGALILGREANQLIEGLLQSGKSKRLQWLPGFFAVTILLSSVVYLKGELNFDRVRFEKATKFSVPQGAVDFIERERIPGNIFNDFGFGGYLTWRLYPWKKNFVDTRSLNRTAVVEYGWIWDATESIRNKKLPEGKTPLWKRLLDHYEVNFIFLDTIGVQGSVPPLLLILLEDSTWAPVYSDLISVIFVKNTVKNREIIQKYGIAKESVYNAVIVRAAQWAIMNENPAYLVSLGDIFLKRGMPKDAVTAYEYAMKRLPRQHEVRLKLEAAKKEIEPK